MYVCLARDCVVHGTWISLGTAALRVFSLISNGREVRRRNLQINNQKKKQSEGWLAKKCWILNLKLIQVVVTYILSRLLATRTIGIMSQNKTIYILRWFDTLSRYLHRLDPWYVALMNDREIWSEWRFLPITTAKLSDHQSDHNLFLWTLSHLLPMLRLFLGWTCFYHFS